MSVVRSNSFPLDGNWQLLLSDLGLSPRAVLRRASLPEDLFARDGVLLPAPEYFRLWRALEQELDDPLLALKLGEVVRSEMFHPVLFAALASSNYCIAAQRISQYKRLVAPIQLLVCEDEDELTVAFEWLEGELQPPMTYALFELVFQVALVRMATREHIYATRVESPWLPAQPEAFERYFGVRMTSSARHCVGFSRADARRPFLTANTAMWAAFEPSLRRRLSELETAATVGDRVHAALLEGLPSGECSMEQIAGKLGISKRTLQRRLRGEGTSFQALLNSTREQLARHYLSNTKLSGGEISYLLGFGDPNSFFRAFHSWTGQTTEQVRAARPH